MLTRSLFFCQSLDLAMCAGIGAPGTLQEILRGYFGDKRAPERFRDDDVVKAGFIEIGPGKFAAGSFHSKLKLPLITSKHM